MIHYRIGSDSTRCRAHDFKGRFAGDRVNSSFESGKSKGLRLQTRAELAMFNGPAVRQSR